MAITREKSTGEVYSGDRFQKRREREKIAGGGDDMRGRPVGVGRGEGKVPVRGGALLGRGLVLAVGWNGSRGPASHFSLLCFFSFSIFRISFTDFAKSSKSNQTTFRSL
jgi:hypothetical protein